MRVQELINALSRFNPDAEVRLMGYTEDDEGKDDFMGFMPTHIHDEFTMNVAHDMVSIEFCRNMK